jgi:hypothetical protein
MPNRCAFSGSNPLPFKDGFMAYQAGHASFLFYSQNQPVVYYIVVCWHAGFLQVFACFLMRKRVLVKVSLLKVSQTFLTKHRGRSEEFFSPYTA